MTQEKEKAYWILASVVPRVGYHHNVLFGLGPPHVRPGMPLLLWRVGPTWGAEGSFPLPLTPSYNNATHAVQQCKIRRRGAEREGGGAIGGFGGVSQLYAIGGSGGGGIAALCYRGVWGGGYRSSMAGSAL